MDKKAERAFRMDIRFAGLQRAKYERAAALKGQTLTQWASSHLDACASCDIAEVTLSDEAFDRFCIILDAPTLAATKELLERKPICGEAATTKPSESSRAFAELRNHI